MAFNTPLFIVSLALLAGFLQSTSAINAALWPKKSSSLGFSWSNCGPGSDRLQLKSLAVTPDPIAVPGNISITTNAVLTAALPSDIHISLTMEKKVGSFYIKIPCIDNVGSCNYGNICGIWADACPKHFAQYGIPCNCPIPANTYSVANAIVAITGKLPSEVTGEFRLTADIGSGEGHIGCLRLNINLTT